MTKIHFYKGLRTIGGTVIEIETENARCLFDFGIIYQKELDNQVILREAALTRDYLKLGILPGIEGIYEKKDLGDIPLKGYERGGKEVFFLISHMHIDHMEALGFLARDIPVYMSEDSRKLYEGIVQVSEYFYRIKRNCTGIQENTVYTVGDISFRMLKTDHDVLGACGYEIKTNDGCITYTGDYRLHGFHPEYTLEFAKASACTDILITEGVTASFMEEEFEDIRSGTCLLQEQESEEKLLQNMNSQIIGIKGLKVLNLYDRNIERAYFLMKDLRKSGKKLILEPELAYYINLFYPGENLYVYGPLIKDKDLNYLFEISGLTIMNRNQLLGELEDSVLQLSYKNILQILDLPYENSLYIHSNGVPLGDYDPAYLKLRELLNKLNISFISLGAGGHAYPAHLKYLLEEINPKYLIPLHSLKPEIVKIKSSIQVLPRLGSTYLFINHELKEAAENKISFIH